MIYVEDTKLKRTITFESLNDFIKFCCSSIEGKEEYLAEYLTKEVLFLKRYKVQHSGNL